MNIENLIAGNNSSLGVDTTIGVGDSVRSYDFADNLDCYVEGVVQEITAPIEGCSRYKIAVDKRVFVGQALAVVDNFVYPPLNGTTSLMGRVTNLVVKL